MIEGQMYEGSMEESDELKRIRTESCELCLCYG
jgi:hypothetical protein